VRDRVAVRHARGIIFMSQPAKNLFPMPRNVETHV
jgi:hypothetical protein